MGACCSARSVTDTTKEVTEMKICVGEHYEGLDGKRDPDSLDAIKKIGATRGLSKANMDELTTNPEEIAKLRENLELMGIRSAETMAIADKYSELCEVSELAEIGGP